MPKSYLAHAVALLREVEETQSAAIETGAAWIADAIEAGGLAHAFGAGHSHMALEEAFPRNGGLVGMHPLTELALSYYTPVVGNSGIFQMRFFQAVEGLGEIIWKNYRFKPTDCFIVYTNTGVTKVALDIATFAKRESLRVIGVTSLKHAAETGTAHAEGKRLHEIADLVIDNCSVTGDAMIEIPGLEDKAGAESSITSIAITNALAVGAAPARGGALGRVHGGIFAPLRRDVYPRGAGLMEYAADVVVAGAGSAGMVAALVAARNGASVLLVERGGFPGGISTAALDTMYAFYTPGERSEKVVSGLPDEVVARIERYDALLRRPNTFGSGTGLTYNPETLKRVWDDMAAEAGVKVLLHSFLLGAVTEGGTVGGIRFVNKAGAHAARAKVVIDATGDADVAANGGGSFELAGRDGAGQTLSTTFRMANVGERALAVKKDELHALMREANASGRFVLPREEGSVHRTPDRGVMATIMTRIPGCAPDDVEGISRAEAEGRAQAQEYFRFLKAMVPGYEEAVLIATSPWIGVRETRRIRGDYQLTGEDVLAATRFPDGIARCGAPIEDHHAGRDTRWAYIPDSGTYTIPFRALLPAGLDGILVAGRCLSATHDAHASARSIGTCMAMGQAAGTAAALAASRNCPPREVPIDALLDTLDRQGADFGQRPAP